MAFITSSQNGYTFRTDTETGTTTASGRLQNLPATRNTAAQRAAGGAARLPTDQGGHLVAARFNGPSTQENLYAQSGNLNQGVYRTMENAEANLLAQGATIDTERTAFLSGSSRPSAFLVNDTITYADGKTSEVHLSFPNLSTSELEEIDEEMSRFDIPDDPNPGDTLREEFSPAEYAALMESTDASLPGIRDMFDEPSAGTSTSSPTAEGDMDTSLPASEAPGGSGISSSEAGGISDDGGIPDGGDDGGLDGGNDGDLDGGDDGGIDDD